MIVGVVIVTYNRKHLLRRCLNALLKQTKLPDRIFVIDNFSTDGTDLVLNELELVDGCKLSYHRLPENRGGAGGFSYGLNVAFSECDWVWMMDDDGYPATDALQLLFESDLVKSGQNVVLNCLVESEDFPGDLAFLVPDVSSGGGLKFRKVIRSIRDMDMISKNGVYPWASFFNGTLLPRSVFVAIGNVRSELFIWGDEVDYFYRIRKHFPIYTLLRSRHFHPSPKVSLDVPPWKLFYGFRNNLMLTKYHRFSFLRKVWLCCRYFPVFYRSNALESYVRAIAAYRDL